MSFTTKHSYFIIIIFINFLFLAWSANVFSMVENHKRFGLFDRFEIYIINAEVDTLMVQCKSDDDDLGDRKLVRSQYFSWSFRENFFFTTHFFCNFRSVTPDDQVLQSTSFNVFDLYISTRCGDQDPVRKCYWIVRKDGFYLTTTDAKLNPDSWKLKRKW